MEASYFFQFFRLSRQTFLRVCWLFLVCIFYSNSVVFADVTSENSSVLQALEHRIEQLEKELNRRKTTHLHEKDAAHSDGDFDSYLNHVTFSGFASFGASVYDAKKGMFLDDNGTTLSATPLTLLGLQMAFEVTENTDFIVQLKAYKSEQETIDAEWAYINHRFNDEWLLRVGAMRLPFFMVSEYMDVGYAQVWANLPTEVYGGTVDLTFTGANIGYQFNWMQSRHLIQTYAGTHFSTDVDVNIDRISIDKLMGLRYDVYLQSWRLGLSHTIGEVNADVKSGINESILPKGTEGDFTGIGIFYEGERFSWLNEWVQQRIDSPYQDEQSFYSSVAYNIQAWTPYLTYAQLKTTDAEGRRDLSLPPSYSQETIAIGTRYDIYSGFALKLEGLYVIDENNSERIKRPSSFTADAGKDSILYTLKLDMVF